MIFIKRYFLLAAFAVSVAFLPAQSIDTPALNPDIMTYFQEEMTSLIRYQFKKEYNESFFLSFRYVATNLTLSKTENGHLADESSEVVENSIVNGFVGTQIKINDALYIPLFAAMAYTRIDGTPEEGTLFIDNPPMSNSFIDDITGNYLMGSGLYFNIPAIKGGIFAAYNLKNSESDYTGHYRHSGDLRDTSYSFNSENTDHSFKLAILPVVDTSSWRYVGKVLNHIVAFAGMGDAVAVFTGAETEKDTTIETVVNSLNYALDMGFKTLQLGETPLGIRCFYRRDFYDNAAKNDVYGAAVKSRLFSFLNFSAEFGYRHFYSVSKFYRSRYPDVGFFDIGCSFSVNKMIRLSASLQYDGIRGVYITTAINVTEAFAAMLSGGGVGRNYKSGKLDIEETGYNLGLGLRYRHSGLYSDDLNNFEGWM